MAATARPEPIGFRFEPCLPLGFSSALTTCAWRTRSTITGTVASYFASCQGMLGFGLDFVGEVD